MTSRTSPARAARVLALGAVAGPVLFTLTWLILGFVSPGYTLFDHRFTDYSPISQPVSGLGMGTTAPYMNTAFVVTGVLLIAGVVGAFRTFPADRPTLRRWSVGLLAGTGVGQIMVGVFDLEVVMLHSLGFFLAIGTAIVGFLVAGRYLRGIPGWRRLGTGLLFGSPLTLALLIGFFATFQPTAEGAEHGIAGLVQRLLMLQVHAWFVAIGWRAYRRDPAGRRSSHDSGPASLAGR
jgi:hypothetical membrane protein